MEMSDYANKGGAVNVVYYDLVTFVTVSCNVPVWKLRKSRLDEQSAEWIGNLAELLVWNDSDQHLDIQLLAGNDCCTPGVSVGTRIIQDLY